MKSYRHQAVVPFAIVYVVILSCLSLVGPLRTAKALIQEVIQGSGRVVKQSRPVQKFDAVEIGGIGELTATQGNKESLTVEAEDNIASLITTEVKNDCLYIQVKPDVNLRPNKPIRYTLTLKELNRIGFSGVIKADIGKINTKAFKISSSGACKATFADVQADKLSTSMSGASNIKITGKAGQEVVDLSGASVYDGENFDCKSADVSVSGACRAVVRASEHLKTEASGISSVRYIGNPTIEEEISGNASLRKK